MTGRSIEQRPAAAAGEACDGCLRRAYLVSELAPRIEGLLQRPGDRVGQLLALPRSELLDALVPKPNRDQVEQRLAAFDPDDARENALSASLTAVCRHDRLYPQALNDLPDAPVVLWVAGGAQRLAELLTGPAVAIVGSRRPSAYGIEVAEQLARGLAATGVTVVSGLALGIDAAAHRGALASPEPRTIAVLGGGADVVYPRTNRALHAAVVERGAIVSESPPGRRPYRWTFPARNRIMAALTAMTIVVEAAERSGSLITASFAADLGRAVAAVPGRVTAANATGGNRLLREGAALVRDVADALDELYGVGALTHPPTAVMRAGVPADEIDGLATDERAVLDALERGVDPAEIPADTGQPAAAVRVALGRLEVRGLVRRSGIGSYERCAS